MRFRAPIFSRSAHRAMPLAIGSATTALFLIAGALIAAPAMGFGSAPDSGRQPPPGTVATSIAPAAPIPTQPPPGAPAVAVTVVAPVPEQPANAHPVKAGPP